MSRRGPNREDIIPVEFYESTPPKLIGHFDLARLVRGAAIRLYFSLPLKETPNLYSPYTYKITGPVPVTIHDVVRYQHKKIEVQISSLQVAGDYYFSVVEDLLDINENVMFEARTPIKFSVDCAQVISATATDTTHFEIIFSEEVVDDSELRNPANYALTYTCDRTPWNFTIPGTAQTDLTVTFSREMLIDEDFCDPANYTIALAPILTPLTYTPRMTLEKKVDIEYSNVMDINVALINPTNYVLSVPAMPSFSYSAEATAEGEVTVTFNNIVDINLDLINTANFTIVKV